LTDAGNKKRDFQDILEKELDKRKEERDGSNDNKWITIKEAKIDGAKKVFGFQKERRTKKIMDYR
jgi:hypothetical protein